MYSATFPFVINRKRSRRQPTSVIPRLHDGENKQTLSKREAIRAHVVHMYIEYVCMMSA